MAESKTPQPTSQLLGYTIHPLADDGTAREHRCVYWDSDTDCFRLGPPSQAQNIIGTRALPFDDMEIAADVVEQFRAGPHGSTEQLAIVERVLVSRVISVL